MRKCYNLNKSTIITFLCYSKSMKFTLAYCSVRSVTIHIAHEPTAGVIDGEPLIVPHDILPLTSSASRYR